MFKMFFGFFRKINNEGGMQYSVGKGSFQFSDDVVVDLVLLGVIYGFENVGMGMLQG